MTLAWTADTAGQGWGINPDEGGFVAYEAMRKTAPDLFIHCGDTVYADQPLAAERRLDDGTLWRNLVTPAKSKVAETLDEFRATTSTTSSTRTSAASTPRPRRSCSGTTTRCATTGATQVLDRRPVPGQERGPARGAGQAGLLRAPPDPLLARTRRNASTARSPTDGSWRCSPSTCGPTEAPNSANRQPASDRKLDPRAGAARVAEASLRRSPATWKVVASDMPLGLLVPDGPLNFEAVANGDGPALGRELEIADLLRFLRDEKVRNVVWITGDVHYCAAHHYDPARAHLQGLPSLLGVRGRTHPRRHFRPRRARPPPSARRCASWASLRA